MSDVPRDAMPDEPRVPVELRGEDAVLARIDPAELVEPFFDLSIQRLEREPGGVDERQVPLRRLREQVGGTVPRPRGVIVHTGRCGSSLLRNMLAHSPSTLSVGEAGVLTTAHTRRLRAAATAPDDALALVLVAFDRYAAASQRQALFKLTSWQGGDLVGWRQVVPDCPAVFIHRDVHEVVASSVASPPDWSKDMVADLIDRPERLIGWMPAAREVRPTPTVAELYAAAWVSIVRGVLAAPNDRTLIVSYADLVAHPEAVLERVAAHVGITDLPMDAALAERSVYAKASDRTERFEPTQRHRRPALSPRTAALVAAVIGDLPDRLAAATSVVR